MKMPVRVFAFIASSGITLWLQVLSGEFNALVSALLIIACFTLCYLQFTDYRPYQPPKVVVVNNKPGVEFHQSNVQPPKPLYSFPAPGQYINV